MTALLPNLTGLRRAMEPVFGHCFSDELTSAYEHVDRLCLELCCHVVRNAGYASPPREARYFVETVFAILAEENFLRRAPQGWQISRSFPSQDSALIQREARALCQRAEATFELIARCREHAAAFVAGREPGLATVFPRGDLALWERLHDEDAVMSIYADMAAAALDALAEPGARVLELGAGVGALARRCRNLLRKRDVAEYWFTDMGKVFVQNARSIFAGEKAMRFAGIDIDLPFDAQEVARESFDIVTAVNVLHVAEDLPATLREIHRTLRTPGYLVCAEGSPPRPGSRWRLDLVFGFLPGWWDVATNSQLRPSPGFLFPSQWRQLLHASGFDVVEAMPGESWFDGPCRGGLIVAAKLP
jgi:SAM-dependent methyltransferase